VLVAVQVSASWPRLEIFVVASEQNDALRVQNLEGE